MLFAEISLEQMLQLLLGFAITLTLIGIAWNVVLRFRTYKDQGGVTQQELITNFREMSLQGGLSPQEYRNIETLLVKSGEERRTVQPRPSSTASKENDSQDDIFRPAG